MQTNYVLIFAVFLAAVFVLRKRYTSKHAPEPEPVKVKEIVKVVKEPPRVDSKPYDIKTKKYTVNIISDQNKVTHDLPFKIKNVTHIELLQAVIPRGEYRINIHNQKFRVTTSIGTNDYVVPVGTYTDIIAILMEVNQLIYADGHNMIIMFSALVRKVVIMSEPNASIDFTMENSIAEVLGFGDEVYTISDPNPFSDDQHIVASLIYFSKLYNNASIAINSVNNVPIINYTFAFDEYGTNLYINGLVTLRDPSTKRIINVDLSAQSVLISPNRVDMKHHLYVDVNIDNVEYWDGSNQLARIYIPAAQDEAEYNSYGDPVTRPLQENIRNLDRLDISLYSVVSERRKHLYSLNGLTWSLAIQITTIDPYLQ